MPRKRQPAFESAVNEKIFGKRAAVELPGGERELSQLLEKAGLAEHLPSLINEGVTDLATARLIFDRSNTNGSKQLGISVGLFYKICNALGTLALVPTAVAAAIAAPLPVTPATEVHDV